MRSRVRGVDKRALQNRRNSAVRSFPQGLFEKVFECVQVVLYGVFTESKNELLGELWQYKRWNGSLI